MTVSNDADTSPVRKTVTVMSSATQAFEVFTAGIDTWWPRTHHIGSGTLEKTVIELKLGGRCYGRTTDGAECDWGRVLVWDPPQRFVMAWQITPQWTYQPDLAQSSEVEVRFTAIDGGLTRVDLEHRHFERHGAGAAAKRAAVDKPGGWSGILSLFAEAAGRPEATPAAPEAAAPTTPLAP